MLPLLFSPAKAVATSARAAALLPIAFRTLVIGDFDLINDPPMGIIEFEIGRAEMLLSVTDMGGASSKVYDGVVQIKYQVRGLERLPVVAIAEISFLSIRMR